MITLKNTFLIIGLIIFSPVNGYGSAPTAAQPSGQLPSNRLKTIILNPNVGTLAASCEGCKLFLNEKVIGNHNSEKKLSAGRYIIRAEKPNFYPEEKEIIIVVGEKNNITFNLSPIMGSYSGSIQQDIDRWEKRAFISLITGGIFTLGGAYFNHASDSAYDNYLQSTSTAEAVDFKQMVKDNNEYRSVMMSIAATAAVNWGFSKLQSATYKNKLKKR